LPSIELRPLRFRLFKLVKEASTDTESKPSWITISAGETVTKLSSEIANAIHPASNTTSPYRIWSIETAPEDENAFELTSSHLSDARAKIVDGSDKTLEEVSMESDDAFVVEFKQEDGWIVEAPKATTATPAASNPAPLFNSNEGFFNKMTSTISPPKTTTTTVAPFKSPGGFFDNYSNSSSITNKSITKSLEPGTLGLGNM
jgi:ubiquitin carboxyl-terminal hydrolase 4/11/15